MPKPKSERVTDNPFGQKLNSVMRAQGIGGDYRALADVFGVRPQSVYDWVKHGRFAKERFADLVAWSGKSLHCWFDVPELSRPTPAPEPMPATNERAATYLVGWPFKTVTKADFDALPTDLQLQIEGYVRGVVHHHLVQKKPAA